MVRLLPMPMIVGLLSIILMAEGYKSLQELCARNSASPQDPRNCDPNRFLVCGKNSLCTCSVNTFWQRATEKCTLPVHGECMTAFGVSGWGQPDDHHGGNGPTPNCPENAACDVRGTQRCICKEGYEPNEELTECNSGEMIRGGMSTTLGLIVCSVLAMKIF